MRLTDPDRHHLPGSSPMKHPPLDGLWELKQEADREQAFWNEHYDEFVQKYPDQFVAVHDGQVIAVSDDPARLVALIRE
jgi:hypothetical protein